jgi:lantibiotic transport system permease protein
VIALVRATEVELLKLKRTLALALPLLVTLQVSLLASLEHGQQHWKDLFALPIPRWSIYGAKVIAGALLLALSLMVLGIGLGLEGGGLNLLRPNLGLAPPIPWLDILRGMATMFGATLLLLALLTWVALRWPSFAVPSGVGITGTVMALILDISSRADTWARVFPWSMPLVAVAPVSNGRSDESHLIALGLGIAGGIVVAILGCWDMTCRDVV